LESTLRRLTGLDIRAVGAGRTDAGVHATGQVAGVLLPKRWEATELRRALNETLPRDMWVAAATEAPDSFHARYDAVARGYVYRLGTTPVSRSPFLRRWCWPLIETVSFEALNDAAQRFVGDHSFRAFAKTGQPQRGERCIMHRAEWREWEPAGFEFAVVANRFLHHMVRYMVGTMVEIARARRPASDIDALLAGTDDMHMSPPAPPEGLYLSRVYYKNEDWSNRDITDEILS